MTFEEKMKALEKALIKKCIYSNCYECDFFDEEDRGVEEEYYCGIMDGNGRVPYNDNWNMKIALGLEEPYKPVFPEAVEESMMKHFTKVE